MTAKLRSAVLAARNELEALETQRNFELSKAKEHLASLEKKRDAQRTVYYWKPSIGARIVVGFLSFLGFGTLAFDVYETQATGVALPVIFGLSVVIAVRGPVVVNRMRERVVAKRLAAMARTIAQAQAEFTQGAEAIRRKWEPAIRSAKLKLEPLESELHAVERVEAQAKAEIKRAAAKAAQEERTRIMQSKSLERLNSELMLKRDELRQLNAEIESKYREHGRNQDENRAYWVRGKGAEPGYGPNFDYFYRRMDAVEREIAEIVEELDRR